MFFNNKAALLFLCAYILGALQLYSQDLDSLLQISAFTAESDLQKGLNKNLAVSALNLTTRETPGIVSVITAEEIQNMGARDLTDVLRLVPGFDIMQDLQFVMGLSLRGNWSNEGKILVMLDGIPFNELLYQTVALGNRFPVDAIERIEIIRGPGSAIYGGSAEYGVINIITKSAESLQGVAVYGQAGLHSSAVGRVNGGVMAAHKTEDFAWDLSFFKGRGIVSDRTYTDIFDGTEYDLTEVTSADPMNVNVGLRHKSLSIRTMYDQFKSSDPVYDMSFKTFAVDAQYGIDLSPDFKITPHFQYLNQVPWYYDEREEPGVDFDVRAVRMLGQVDADYNVSRKVHLNFGVLYFQDASTDQLEDEKMLELNNFAFYSQALFKHRLFNATAGFRFEKNNRYNGAFVPRLGITKKIENLHFKLLYSKSFRAPSLQNVLLDTTGAKPERSDVFEFEFGYQFTPEMLLAVNAFYITTRDVIIYGSSEDDETAFTEWYENYSKSGSKGFEVVYNIRKKQWYAHLTYSFSQAIKGNTVDKYVVPQTSKQYVGMPAHKVTLTGNVQVTPSLSVSPSVIRVSKRYAFVGYLDEPVAGELNPYTLFNLFINYKPSFAKGLTGGVGVFDLFNEQPPVPQAYNGGAGIYAPIPGRSQEYVIKLSYQVNFKK